MRAETRRRLPRLIVIGLLLIALIAAIVLLTGGKKEPTRASGISTTRLSCTDNDSLRAFGSRVLYYDGNTIYCFSASGSVVWKFEIGQNAWYDCDDTHIVAWRGSSIYVINKNGESTYSDSLGDNIQFARIGKQYVGAVVGENTAPRLVVKDLNGAHMDEESDAYDGLLLLNLGFYGSSGQYMWTLAMDVYGTAANTILNTFEVGRMNTGEVSLGEPICYAAVYENGKLHVINTRKMRTFNDKGTEDASDSKLVYGWHYLYSEVPARGDAMFLFAPNTETSSASYTLSELRTLCGSTDKRYSLPKECVGATLYKGVLYAVADDTLYRAATTDTRFTSYALPMEQPVTAFIDTLQNGSILVACGDEPYLISLP